MASKTMYKPQAVATPMDGTSAEGSFTLALALADAIPVLLFAVTVFLLSTRFHNLLFYIGSALIILAGLGKVLWKILMVIDMNVKVLARQFRYLLPTGFLLQIISLFTMKKGLVAGTFAHCFKVPSLLFFILGFCTMGVMFYMGKHNDLLDAKANKKEQAVNICMQGLFLLGVSFL